MSAPTRFLIIEPDRATVATLEHSLRAQGREVVGSFGDAESVLSTPVGVLPDVVLLALAAGSLGATREKASLLRTRLSAPVIYLADARARNELEATTDLPGFSYVYKPAGLRELLVATDAAFRIHQLETRLRQLESKMQEAQRLEGIGVMAGGVAHDFNNLLTGILGASMIARTELPPESPAQYRLGQIEEASQRAAELCQRLMAQVGRSSSGARLLSINSLVEETLQLAKSGLKPDVTIQSGFAPDLAPVMAEEAQLRQAISNLIANAAEAIGDAAGVVRVVTFTRHLDGTAVAQLRLADDAAAGDFNVVEVADTGCGMTPEVLARIFDPLFTTKAAGRGLGLAAVARAVRKLHGGLSVESAPGRGAVFRLFVPVARDRTKIAEVQPVPTPVSSPGGAVLIVDDDEAVRALAKWVVERAGYHAVTASDGDDALRRFRADAGAFRLVLLDLTMPRMSGEETLVGLRAIRPQVPVVIITGHGEDAVRDEEKEGVVGFLQKPFSPDSLRTILNRHVPITGSASPVPPR